jgi:hypothetical protein
MRFGGFRGLGVEGQDEEYKSVSSDDMVPVPIHLPAAMSLKFASGYASGASSCSAKSPFFQVGVSGQGSLYPPGNQPAVRRPVSVDLIAVFSTNEEVLDKFSEQAKGGGW